MVLSDLSRCQLYYPIALVGALWIVVRIAWTTVVAVSGSSIIESTVLLAIELWYKWY
jgi:hypothetical protein